MDEDVTAIREYFSDSHHSQDIALLTEALLGKPHPVTGRIMDAHHVIRFVDEFDLLARGASFGWIKPEGKVLGCVHAAHERLLKILGLETRDVELAGWARLGPNGYQARYRLTTAQTHAVKRRGGSVDNALELLKEPMPAAISHRGEAL